MSSPHRRRTGPIIALLLLLLLIALLLLRCRRPATATIEPTAPPPQDAVVAAPVPSSSSSGTGLPDEVLGEATIDAPSEVAAGVEFAAGWTGPGNHDDYLTIVRPDAAPDQYANYTLTRTSNPAQLTAPIDAGDWEIRYVTGRSRTVLGRVPLKVLAAAATLSASDHVTLDTPLEVRWSGPNNTGDFVTIVAPDQPDSASGPYAMTKDGPVLTITAPYHTGRAEIRYVTGQDRRVLARRPLQITQPHASLHAPARAIAGSMVSVDWTGPKNSGDYVTVVPADLPDGQHRNYTMIDRPSPVAVMMPIEPGGAELRYMTGRGAQVLARLPIQIVAAEITLSAPATAQVGAAVSIAWSGPANNGDYLTIVAQSADDRKFGHYTMTTQGSPLTVNAPKETGAAEIRYIAGQGGKVLARRPITLTP